MKIIPLSVALLASLLATAQAAIKTSSPEEVCSIGTKAGLPTRGWKEIGGMYGCSSSYKEIGTGSPLANNLAFYATGQIDIVQKVKLVLNVNNKTQSKKATQQLVAAASSVLHSLTGKPISKHIEQALSSGKATEESIGLTKVKVLRDNWPIGAGYEVQLVIE